MNKDIFNEAQILQAKISTITQNLRQIEKLLISCGLECTITGTPPNVHSRTIPYTSYNKKFIKLLLENDKKELTEQLSDLTDQFDALN